MSDFNIFDFLLFILSASYSLYGFKNINPSYYWNKRYIWSNRIGYGVFFLSILIFIIFTHIDLSRSIYEDLFVLGVLICTCFIIGFCWFIMDGATIQMELDFKFQNKTFTSRYNWCKAWKKVIVITEVFLLLMLIWGLFIFT